jgi:hypothetical protein
VLDVLGHDERERALGAIRALLAPGGLLLFSAHNLGDLQPGGGFGRAGRAAWPAGGRGRALRRAAARGGWLVSKAAHVTPLEAAALLRRAPVRWRNRRRMRRLERRGDGYALINDEALDYALLHYYIDRDSQAAQLQRLGYELLECLDAEGRVVPAGARAAGSPWLHYVARPSIRS